MRILKERYFELFSSGHALWSNENAQSGLLGMRRDRSHLHALKTGRAWLHPKALTVSQVLPADLVTQCQVNPMDRLLEFGPPKMMFLLW